jgi:acetylornithine/succinyldiaminopimelate/putrescine aminotransferase
MSRHLFRIELEFNENVDFNDDETMKIAENIARAVVHEAQGGEGISPSKDAYTKAVRVSPWFLNETVIKDVY